MTTTPAEEFAAIVRDELHGQPSPTDAALPAPAASVVRAPSPNRAQGTSSGAGVLAPDPAEALAAALDDLIRDKPAVQMPRGTSAAEAGQYVGWRDLRP